MRSLALLGVLLATSTASAEGLAPHESIAADAKGRPRPYGISVNQPFGWKSGFAIAGSAYARVADHHVLRLNVASYEYHGDNIAADLIAGIVFQGDSDVSHKGRLFDVGAGWMYFPRRTWEGPTFEAGLLHRSVDTEQRAWEAEVDTLRDGRTIAARALLGWSWTIRNRVMISFAMGASRGYTFGTEVTRDWSSLSYEPTMTTTARYGEWTNSFEGNLRFGFTFGN